MQDISVILFAIITIILEIPKFNIKDIDKIIWNNK